MIIFTNHVTFQPGEDYFKTLRQPNNNFFISTFGIGLFIVAEKSEMLTTKTVPSQQFANCSNKT